MEDMFEANKSALKSMLLDEEKLITYVSLSKDLCVHINTSKLLLLRLVNIVQQERPDLQVNVNYIISGATQNNNARTIICSEKDLRKEKESFTNIFYEHIYSVSIGNLTVDTAAYLSVNKFEDFVLCSGLIKSDQCNKRTSAEICNLKSNSQEIVAPEKSKSVPILLKKVKQETETTKNGEVDPVSKHNGSKSEPLIKTELLTPKKEVLVDNKSKITSTINQKTQKGIAGFFNKSNKKDIKEKVVPVAEAKVESDENVKNEAAAEVVTEVANIKDVSKKDNESNRILNQIKKSSKVDQKRKRVLKVSDSESDNENNDPFMEDSVPNKEVSHESDDEIPPTPTTNNIKITSCFLNPKKKRKIVDKTYTDEDGYILTKKEEVYESCSDGEEKTVNVIEKPQAIPVKTEISPKGKTNGSKKKVSPPQKGKQPTMTNFFKKI